MPEGGDKRACNSWPHERTLFDEQPSKVRSQIGIQPLPFEACWTKTPVSVPWSVNYHCDFDRSSIDGFWTFSKGDGAPEKAEVGRSPLRVICHRLVFWQPHRGVNAALMDVWAWGILLGHCEVWHKLQITYLLLLSPPHLYILWCYSTFTLGMCWMWVLERTFERDLLQSTKLYL